MEKEIYNLLYSYRDEDGIEKFDLFEVQLAETIDKRRVQLLIGLLHNEDRYIVYQAMLILVAWGVEEGFNKASQFYNERWDRLEEFEPHRIYGEDNVYDVIAYALYISMSNNINVSKILPFYIEFLSIYGNVFFEGKLQSALLKNDAFRSLVPNVEQAIDNALQNGRYYQASQLLKVLQKYNDSNIKKYIRTFEGLVSFDERIQYNLDELKEET